MGVFLYFLGGKPLGYIFIFGAKKVGAVLYFLGGFLSFFGVLVNAFLI
jgi:hypothetical protein